MNCTHCVLVLVPLLAASPWWDDAREGRAGHYFVRTDLSAERAAALCGHLNLMHDEYARRLPGLPARAPMPLNALLFEQQRDYLETLQWRFGVDASGTGGMFFVNPQGQALAAWLEGRPLRRVLHVLQHEGFHQFAYSRFGTDLPPWADEGLAEVFGRAVAIDGRFLFGGPSARLVEEIQSSVEEGAYVPFHRMLAMTTADWSAAVAAGSASGLYRQAWSMVHFLLWGDGGRYAPAFDQYLKLVNEGHLSQEAFRRAFETDDAAAFEERWKAHVLAMSPGAFLTALDRIEFLAAGAAELGRRGEPLSGGLEELRRRLMEIDFTCAVDEGAQEVILRATGPMFTIPVEDPSAEPAVFAVSSRKAAPPEIETRFLKPRNMVIRWLDDGASALTFEIDVR